ncbi:hypothetical protein VTK26DRAFT_9269 [Humicola hyalothermophila]
MSNPSHPQTKSPDQGQQTDHPPRPQTELPPPLLTLPHHPNIHLRPHHPSDAPFVRAAADDPAVARFMAQGFRSPFTSTDAELLIGYSNAVSSPLAPPGTILCYAICDGATGRPVGGVGAARVHEDIESRTLEVGCWLGRGWWGRGIMTAALREYVRWAFRTLRGLNRIEAMVFEGNERSVRLMEKVGFTHEGTRRRAGEKDGWVFDIMVWGLLREECLREGK